MKSACMDVCYGIEMKCCVIISLQLICSLFVKALKCLCYDKKLYIDLYFRSVQGGMAA